MGAKRALYTLTCQFFTITLLLADTVRPWCPWNPLVRVMFQADLGQL